MKPKKPCSANCLTCVSSCLTQRGLRRNSSLVALCRWIVFPITMATLFVLSFQAAILAINERSVTRQFISVLKVRSEECCKILCPLMACIYHGTFYKLKRWKNEIQRQKVPQTT